MAPTLPSQGQDSIRKAAAPRYCHCYPSYSLSERMQRLHALQLVFVNNLIVKIPIYSVQLAVELGLQTMLCMLLWRRRWRQQL